MRKGQWAGFEGIKVDKDGKMVEEGKTPAPSKMGNIICEYEGIKFQSKKERDYYSQNLLPRYKRGEVKWFLRQVKFECGAGVSYRADFVEIWKDNSIHIFDVKGMRTQVFINKKKQVESLYPVRIEEVK